MSGSGSLSSILNPAGTGLSISGAEVASKAVRSNDRLFQHESDVDRQTEQVIKSIQTAGDHYRHDNVRDINWTMTIVANSIKVVSAVLTILAVDQTDRSDDDYDEAIGTLLSIGASVLRVLGERILEYYNSSQESLVSKIGEAAPTTEILDLNIASGQQDSEEEVQRKKQTHVEDQVKKENLNEAQAELLLAQTLEYNGLPQLQSPSKIGLLGDVGSSFLPPLPNFLENLLSPGEDFHTVNRLGEAADTEGAEAYSSLPQPGTLEHTLKLGLFKIQQGINRVTNNPENILNEVSQLGYSLISGQPVADQKIGEIPSIPSSTSFSEVNVSPTNVALGVLATGAIGSVMYSYFTNSALATGAASIASAIRRNDLVVAASDILGLEERVEPPEQLWIYDYYDDTDADYRYNGLYPPLPQYPDIDYREELPYGPYHYQTQFSDGRQAFQPITKHGHTEKIRPVYKPHTGSDEEGKKEEEEVDEEEEVEEMNSLDTALEPITIDMIQPAAADLPYIVYSDETNPWDVVGGEVSSNNLYKRSGQV